MDDLVENRGALQLRIHFDEDPEEREENRRDLKTANAERLVPIPRELEQLGFPGYVARVKAGGSARLFPRWKRGNDGYYSSGFSKWFNERFLKKHGIKTRRVAFHSFRHSYKDALVRAGLRDEASAYVMGHVYDRTHARYGSDGLQPNEVELVRGLSYGIGLQAIRRKA